MPLTSSPRMVSFLSSLTPSPDSASGIVPTATRRRKLVSDLRSAGVVRSDPESTSLQCGERACTRAVIEAAVSMSDTWEMVHVADSSCTRRLDS